MFKNGALRRSRLSSASISIIWIDGFSAMTRFTMFKSLSDGEYFEEKITRQIGPRLLSNNARDNDSEFHLEDMAEKYFQNVLGRFYTFN